MPEEIDFLSIFEGLTSGQAQELKGRIIPTLKQEREKITAQQLPEPPSVLDGLHSLISQLRKEGEEEHDIQADRAADALEEAEWQAYHLQKQVLEQIEEERNNRYNTLSEDEEEESEKLVDQAIDEIEIRRGQREQEELNLEFNQAMNWLYTANRGRPTQSQKRDLKKVYEGLGLKDFTGRMVE